MKNTTFFTELENEIKNLTDFDYNNQDETRLTFAYENNGRNKYLQVLKQNWADDNYVISFYTTTDVTKITRRTSSVTFSINEVKDIIKKAKTNLRGAINVERTYGVFNY